jgi:hypothetical protein
MKIFHVYSLYAGKFSSTGVEGGWRLDEDMVIVMEVIKPSSSS